MRDLVVAFALFGSVATAQQAAADIAFLPIADLLRAPRPADRYLGAVPLYGVRRIEGEESWLLHEGEWPRAWVAEHGAFSADALTALLGELIGRPEAVLQAASGQLVVAADTADVARRVLAELVGRLPPELRVSIALERDGQVLLRREVLAWPGRACWASAVDATRALVDYDVELAQGSSIAAPVVRSVNQGAMVVLRPYVAPAGDALLVEVLARVAVPHGDRAADRIDVGHPGFGPVDRLSQHRAELGAVVQLRLGEPPVVRSWRGPDGAQCALSLQARWQPPAPVRPGGHEVEYAVDLPRTTGFRSVAGPEDDEELVFSDVQGPLESRGLDELVETLQLAAQQVLDDGHARVALDDDAERLRAALAARVQAAAPGPEVRVAWFDVPAGGGADAEGARRLGAVQSALVEGSWLCATAGAERSYLTDYYVEVAQSSRIPDPIVRRVADGLFVNLRLVRGQLDVDGELILPGEDRDLLLALDQAIDVPKFEYDRPTGREGATETVRVDAASLPQDTVRVELPVRRHLPFRLRVPLRAEPAEARIAAPALGDGRELLLVVAQG